MFGSSRLSRSALAGTAGLTVARFSQPHVSRSQFDSDTCPVLRQV